MIVLIIVTYPQDPGGSYADRARYRAPGEGYVPDHNISCMIALAECICTCVGFSIGKKSVEKLNFQSADDGHTAVQDD